VVFFGSDTDFIKAVILMSQIIDQGLNKVTALLWRWSPPRSLMSPVVLKKITNWEELVTVEEGVRNRISGVEIW
jgi:hypothetical protein